MNKRPNIRRFTRYRVIVRDLCTCRYCGRRENPWWDEWEIDHILPVAAGGRNRFNLWQGNLALSCRSCNRSKGARIWQPTPIRWYQRIVSAILIIVMDWPKNGDY